MNTFSQNRTNVRYNRFNPYSHNGRQQGHYMQNKNFNSPWGPQSLPGSEKYWCETCDKGFMTNNLLNYHQQSHQKCKIDGCEFVAHPKVITKHIQMQHATGLYKRISQLNNPEEINKWREERKNKYPTKENIENRKAEYKEKIKRGEKMGLKHKMNGVLNNKPGFNNKGRQSMPRDKCIRKFYNKNNTEIQLSNKKRPVKKNYNIVPPLKETRKLQPFRGIQDLVLDDFVENEIPEECIDLIDDEDVNDIELLGKEVLKPTVCGALTSLMCNYESTEEEDIEKNAIKTNNFVEYSRTIVKPKVIGEGNKALNGSKEFFDKSEVNVKELKSDIESTIHNNSGDDSGPEETKIKKEDDTTNNDSKPIKILPGKPQKLKKYVNVKNIKGINNFKRKLPSTLLEKLLHKEIKHERNVILQCIRYVVENKYFDKV